MTTKVCTTDPRNLSTEQIFSEIESFTALAVDVLKRWSALLAELKRRRVPNIMFNHPVLQFWESIHKEKLDAQAAVLLADRRDGKMIRAVLPLPPSEQLAIAKGKPIAVATLTSTGKIRSEEVPILRMDNQTLTRAFGPDGIRTVYEQAEMIRAAGTVQRIGMVTVLRDEHMVKVGNVRLKWPEDFEAVARALGTEIVTTRKIVADVKTKERANAGRV